MSRDYQYYCPECYQEISDEEEIIFDVSRSNGDKLKLFLNKLPRNYNIRSEPPTDFVKGELVEFYCPHCTMNLESPQYDKFIEIELKINGKGSIEVSFSKIYGERRTFLGLEEL